jgi:hypothetical protein
LDSPNQDWLAAKLVGLLGLGLRDSSQKVALMERSVVRASELKPGSPQSLFPAIKKPPITPHVWRRNHRNPRDITVMLIRANSIRAIRSIKSGKSFVKM